MKTLLIAAAISLAFAHPALAADNSSPQGRNQFGPGSNDSQQGQKMTVEQKKTEILAHIDQRISNNQAERACVQAASSHDALRACREKFRPPRPENMGQGQNRPPRMIQQ